MVNIDMGGNSEFLTVRPGQTGPSNYPPGFFICSSSSIIPSTTHTQAGATPITTQQVIATPANAADGIVLPQAIAGAEVVVVNGSGTLAMQVYAQGTDTINGTAGSTGISQALNIVNIFYCFVAGAWVTK